MDTTILAAIIGGLATVGGSILAVMLTRLFDNPMGFQKNVRQASLIGHWEGTVQQLLSNFVNLQFSIFLIKSAPLLLTNLE